MSVNRIKQAFTNAKSEQRAALIMFTTVGHPNLDVTVEVVTAMESAGADLIELGIPFSDPLAEGAIIQAANATALREGITPPKCVELVAKLRDAGVKVPLIFLSYFNPILRIGITRFCEDAVKAGTDGIIIPDLPAHEAKPLISAVTSNELAFIPMIAPTSTDYAIKAALTTATGFIYMVSRLGVTGVEHKPTKAAHAIIRNIKNLATTPVALGFGISKKRDVANAAQVADGVIVGSALVKAIDQAQPCTQAIVAARLVRELRPHTTKRI